MRKYIILLALLLVAIANPTYADPFGYPFGAKPNGPGLISIEGLTETNGGMLYGTADNAYAWLAAGAQGTLLMGNGAGAPSWLGAGTAGYFLIGAGAADPVWTSQPTLVSLEGLTISNGSLIYGTAADTLASLAAGTANYYLQANGAGAPTWVNDFNTATTIGTAYIYRVGGTDVAAGDMVSALDSAQGAVELATTTETAAGTDATRAVTPDGLQAYIGTGLLEIQAGAMTACTTNPAGWVAALEYGTNDIDKANWLFDAGATNECTQFDFYAPPNWDLGTIKFKFLWDGAATASGTAKFGLKCKAEKNDGAIDAAWGTGVVVEDTLLAVGDWHESPASTAVTIGNTPDAASNIQCRSYRDSDNDTIAVDVLLFKYLIQYNKTLVYSAW